MLLALIFLALMLLALKPLAMITTYNLHAITPDELQSM
jgi:hypothetical protein